MSLAADRLLDAARLDPTILRRIVKLSDVIRATESLAGTYVIRLFAEFETGLRSYWATLRSTQPRTVDLLQAISITRGVSNGIDVKAQEVRRDRNSLVHEKDEAVPALPIDEVRSTLGEYVARLPLDW